MATSSYGDSLDPFREQHFTRAACAELLIDAGAVIAPGVCDGLVASRAKGLLDLFHRKGLLPRSLEFFAALGDLDGVHTCVDTKADGPAAVNRAFLCACAFQRATAAALLLDRSIALDAGLGSAIENGPGRSAFVQYVLDNSPNLRDPDPPGLWQAFVMRQALRALDDGDLTSFAGLLRREAWLLSDDYVKFQVVLIEGTAAALNDRAAFLKALLDLDPAVLRSPVPPPAAFPGGGAIEHAFTYAQTHLLPMLLRIWPMPDDLPHAAGNGDFARVRSWFDVEGKPALGDLANHFPANNAHYRRDLQAWIGREPAGQQVLDTALAWAVLNHHFEIADFLLGHGADINTNWSSHEPASILHELVWHKDYEAMQFLIDRGIDMTIVDYRWGGTARGWAYYAAKDETMAQWLAKAQQRREQASPGE